MGNRVSPRNRWPWVLSALVHLGVVGLAVALWVTMAPPPRAVPVLKLVAAQHRTPVELPPEVPTPSTASSHPQTAPALSGTTTEVPLSSDPGPDPASPPTEPPQAPVVDTPAAPPETEPAYLPQSQVTQVPRLPLAELRPRLRYPTAARRLGLEATVGLELLIDRTGVIRQVLVIQDPGHGFAEAAVKAFEGLTCTPAQADGVAVAVRFRVPVRFRLDQML